jgi:uracil-DNA glycosylase
MPNDALLTLFRECAASLAATAGEQAGQMVFGDGLSHKPPLMLIGEAPGEQEALRGKPFVGKAGKNLTEFLASVGLSREKLYITNVVKFRPTRISAAGRTVNRPPSRMEIAAFQPWLHREIRLVRPRALVTLGNVALGAFLPGATIGECHGRWLSVTVLSGSVAGEAYPLFALYHPASVIYNRSLAAVYENDLRTLRDTLAVCGGISDG